MNHYRGAEGSTQLNRAAKFRPSFDDSSHQLLAAAARVGLWVLDLVTDRAMICENLAPLLGLPPHPHELSGDEWRSVVLNDDLKHIQKQIGRVCKTGREFNVEFRVRHVTGKIVWLQSKGEVKKSADGHVDHLVGVCFDITARKKVDAALRQSLAQFRILADASPDGILVNCRGKLVYANRAAAKILGAGHSRDLAKLNRAGFADQNYFQSAEERVKAELETSTTAKPIAIPLRRLDGSEAIAELTYGWITWRGEKALQIFIRDVTVQKRKDDELRVMHERLKLAVEGSGEGIWDYDFTTDAYQLSGGVKAILGDPEEDVPHPGKEWSAIIHSDDLPKVRSAFHACTNATTPAYRSEYRIRACDGSWKWILSRGIVVSRDEQGKPKAMTGTISDITAKRDSEEIAWQQANLDPLTGRPNRRHFIENLETELQRATRSGTVTALLFIDLDGFKQVNDLFGYETGDLLLMEVVYRIQEVIRESDCLGRLGGDEFTVMLKDLRDPNRVEFVCQNILCRLSEPFAVKGEFAYLSASIGVALSPVDGVTAEELLRKADTAMYSAKSSGKNQFCYFAQSMDERAHKRLRLSTELRHAIALRQLSLCYQPVIDLRNGLVVETEALLRWHHPKFGQVSPSVFVPIAEEAGLMSEIGNWVFHEAASRTKKWSEITGSPIKVALNKSPVQFSRRYMESDWLAYLRQIGLPPSSVVVEITEGVLLHASEEVNSKLLEYRDAGIQVAIDDFGTGYSSLAYLQKFDIDYLKIDQSFVRGIPHDQGNCTIAETIIVMAHKLGQQVIAEGIETKEQADFLRQADCDYGQGFYFSPPLSADKVEGVLARHYR